MIELKRYQKLQELLNTKIHNFSQFKQKYFATDLNRLIELNLLKKYYDRKTTKLELNSVSALEDYIVREFPYGKPQPNPNHQEAALHLKDAHKATRRDVVSVDIRTTQKSFVLGKVDVEVDIASTCETGLAYCLPIFEKQANWSFSGRVCTVENLDNFWKAETVVEADLYIYLAGNFSDQILEYLSSEGLSACNFIHWGDYDPVGVHHYLRIRKACGANRADLYLPENVEELIRTGNTKRVKEQKVNFLEEELTCSKAEYLVGLFREYGKGRDQEASLKFVNSDTVE